MPSAYRWTLRASDGTVIKREIRITDALAAAYASPDDGVMLRRERVTLTRGPQAKRPKVREDQPPEVPARRAPDPAPMPGERIDAFGNAIRD